jgi:poly-beta-hydroxyalkanoate depolymerase
MKTAEKLVMETKDYLDYVVHQIHRTIVATVDEEGLPVTAAIDMMDCDESSHQEQPVFRQKEDTYGTE